MYKYNFQDVEHHSDVRYSCITNSHSLPHAIAYAASANTFAVGVTYCTCGKCSHQAADVITQGSEFDRWREPNSKSL